MDDKIKKLYDERNDLWGFPQTYKGVQFYPILLKDTQVQKLFYHIFQYPKSYIPNKKILKMSYLKYLLYAIEYSIEPKGDAIRKGLTEILKYSTKKEKVEFKFTRLDIPGDDIDDIDRLSITLHIGDVHFTEQDFDIIREIILKQNGMSVEYVEEFNVELEERLKFSGNDLGDVSFEEQIVTFCCLLRCTVHDILDYTIYQFKIHFERLMMLANYELYAPLETSGAISTKTGEKITTHFMMHIGKKGRYSSILIPADKFLEEHPFIADASGKTRPFKES